MNEKANNEQISRPSLLVIAIGAALGAIGASVIGRQLNEASHRLSEKTTMKTTDLRSEPRNVSGPSGEGNTDVAALCAAITAVAITMFSSKGPFQLLGAAVALSLAFVVFGYVWAHRRTKVRTVAVAMILGLIAVPIFGFGMELYSAHDRMSLLTQGEPLSCQYPDEGEWHACGDTVIHHQWLVVVWATVTVLVAVADRRYRQPTLKGP